MTKTRRRTTTRRGLKDLLVLSLLVLSGLALGVPAASAATPCWAQVLNDWFVDGRIDRIYPIACYTQANQHLGEDAVNYSGAPDDIRRALLAAIRQDRPNGPGGGASSGGIVSPSSPSAGGKKTARAPGATPPTTQKGPVTRAIGWLGPSNAESIPLPLLVLASIGFLLLAAAAASWLARRIRARRIEPAPAPAPRGPSQP
jgi:hypothetical protein